MTVPWHTATMTATTTASHEPQLAAGTATAPVIEVYCRACGVPRMFEDRHTNQIGASPLDTCTRCDRVVHMVCTMCGTRYQPQPAYRTPAWLR